MVEKLQHLLYNKISEMQEKMKRNNEKYPVEKAKNSAKKYNEL